MKRTQLDLGLKALVGLLVEMRKGNLFDPQLEREGMERHTSELAARWDHRFPGFPQHYFPFTSFRGEWHRGQRDEYLRRIIVQCVSARSDGGRTIVNPACVFGRHARDLASRLPLHRVVGADIFPLWNWIYSRVPWKRTPRNFEFIRDNVFDPKLEVSPAAVVFFGACGSISDGAMDYAIRSRSPYLICRTCCHDNIGGNMGVAKRPTFMNRFMRVKNWSFKGMRKKQKYTDFYFSDKYALGDYPRSAAGRGVSTSGQFLEASRNSPDSDICRAIIDLDRYLYLIEHGYDVLYRGELFIAERTND